MTGFPAVSCQLFMKATEQERHREHIRHATEQYTGAGARLVSAELAILAGTLVAVVMSSDDTDTAPQLSVSPVNRVTFR
jgi:hypothetical protein